jgi:hypothetical protein
MKRTLQILLLALMASTLGAATVTEPKVESEKASVSTAPAKKSRRLTFRKRRPAAIPDVLVKKAGGAIPGPDLERERKQSGFFSDDDEDKDKVKKKVGPTPQGPPVELHMTRGSNKKDAFRRDRDRHRSPAVDHGQRAGARTDHEFRRSRLRQLRRRASAGHRR